YGNRGLGQARLDESRSLRDGDVGVDVDGNALRPDLAARFVVLARRGCRVLVPLLHHLPAVCPFEAGVFRPLIPRPSGNPEPLLEICHLTSGSDPAFPYRDPSKHTEMLRHNGVVELDLIGGAAKPPPTGAAADRLVR